MQRDTNRLIQEYQKRNKFPIAVQAYVDSLTPVQQQMFVHPARFKAAHSGRRAGKTHLGRVVALQAAGENPGDFIPIFERTATCAAARVMWRELRRDNLTWSLGLKFNETTKVVTCPNGSQIGIVGVDKIDETEKVRGDHHPVVIVDEAGTFRPAVLTTLYREAIRPALIDTKGSLWMIGTPNAACLGPFHDACMPESGFEVFAWDMRDNPYIKDADAEIESILKEYGWTWQTPAFRREILGEWAFDGSNLVYDFRSPQNIEKPPDTIDAYVIGIDLGWKDDTAIVVLGFHRHHTEKIWVVAAWKEPELTVFEIAQHVREFAAHYEPDAIVCDTGGLGKTLVEEMRRRHGLPIEAAEKVKKNASIELLNSDLRTDKLAFAPDLTELYQELRTLQWAPMKFRSDVRRIAEGCDDHLADAMLYAWRRAYHWVNERLPSRVPAMHDPRYEEYLLEQQTQLYHQPNVRADDAKAADEELHWPTDDRADPFADDWGME